MSPFLFKPLCENDLELLHAWFQEPTVNQWYAEGKHWSLMDIKQKYLPRIQHEDNVPSYIIYKDHQPIGFIQYYSLTEHFPEGIYDNHHPLFKSYQPKELVGLDLLIAHQKDRGKGFGKQILNCFVLKLPANIQAIIVDPNSNNHQAIQCYEKAGFEPTSYSEDKTNLILLKILPKRPKT